MRMNVVVIDPPGYPYAHFLFDTVRMLHFTLLELGVDATLTRNRLEPGRINILCGIHLLAGTAEVEEILRQEQAIIVLQTEMIHGRTINREVGDRIDDVVLPLCQGAVAVWDSSPENIEALAEMGIQAELLRFGHQPKICEVEPRERDVDFFFYGSITPDRGKILAELGRLGYRVETCFDEASVFRNDLIARSEVVLTLRQSAAMPHLPHARILYLVANKALVAGQGGVNEGDLCDLFLSSRDEDPIEFLRCVRARRDKEEVRRTHHARLAKRPMKDYVAPLLEGLS